MNTAFQLITALAHSKTPKLFDENIMHNFMFFVKPKLRRNAKKLTFSVNSLNRPVRVVFHFYHLKTP